MESSISPGMPAFADLQDDIPLFGRDAKTLLDATSSVITQVWHDSRATAALLSKRNEGVRYAMANDWDEVVVDERIKILMILPDSFRAVSTAFAESPDVERRLYGSLNDISRLLENSAGRIRVMVGPTTGELIPKRERYKLATSLATAARMGMKVIAAAPPRGDKSYARNRADMIEAIELAKSAAVTMKQGLRCLIPSMESPQEPSHGPGAHPRRSSAEAYSREVIQEYYEALRTYSSAQKSSVKWFISCTFQS
nr:unnamed protein product [Haemonchus contortus]